MPAGGARSPLPGKKGELMQQTYAERGKIAFLEDQAAMAAEAFRQGDFPGVLAILNAIDKFIGEWLAIEQPRGN